MGGGGAPESSAGATRSALVPLFGLSEKPRPRMHWFPLKKRCSDEGGGEPWGGWAREAGGSSGSNKCTLGSLTTLGSLQNLTWSDLAEEGGVGGGVGGMGQGGGQGRHWF